VCTRLSIKLQAWCYYCEREIKEEYRGRGKEGRIASMSIKEKVIGKGKEI